MARKEPRAPRRESETPARNGKGGGMIAGLVIGLVVGLVVAAGLAWYFNLGAGHFKAASSQAPVEKPAAPPAKPVPPKAEAAQPAPPEPASPAAPAESTVKKATKPAQADTAPPTTKPRVDYTFYGILPGDKPAKPVEPPKSNETWWLQVAALKNTADADKLKARLTLLGLQVSTQKVESTGQVLYRIRVGPYKREDDALGDLDTLAQNNFEPRLFKEPVKP